MTTANDGTQTQTSGTNGGDGSQSSGSQSSAASAAVVSRPDWLPETIWDGERNAPKVDLAKALSERDELTAFKAAHDSRLAAVPEDPTKYELKLPSDWKPPEGIEKFELDPEDPRWPVVRQIAKEAGVDQPGFEKIVGIAAEYEAREQAQVAKAVEAQLAAMGPKAQERIEAVKTWVGAKAGPEFLAAIEPMLRMKNGVEGFERLVRAATSGGQSGFSATGREAGKDDAKEEFEAVPLEQRTGRRGFALVREMEQRKAS